MKVIIKKMEHNLGLKKILKLNKLIIKISRQLSAN